MREVVNFALLREGTSDDGLISHLRQLIVRAGAIEAIGTSRPFSGTIENKLRLFESEPHSADIVFIHRDADSAGRDHRVREIAAAGVAVAGETKVVPLVPVQELEAWLLVDEQAIRDVVGRPNGKTPLGLPKVKAVEATSSPKEVLEAACLAASEKSGRRREKEKRLFNQRRGALLERLDPDGPLQELEAWRMLRDEISQVVAGLSDSCGLMR